MSFKNVISDSHNVAVHDANKVFPANIKNIVARIVMLVNLHAACAEQLGDVIFAEECRGDLEAPSASESSENVISSNDGIANHMMVSTQHLRRDLRQRHHLTWADLGFIHIHTLTKE